MLGLGKIKRTGTRSFTAELESGNSCTWTITDRVDQTEITFAYFDPSGQVIKSPSAMDRVEASFLIEEAMRRNG